jgi:hypothetical protein
MKMPVMKLALLASLAAAQLFSIQAAYAQRYHEAPPAYGAVDHSRVKDYRSFDQDQRTINEITGNDWNAGK